MNYQHRFIKCLLENSVSTQDLMPLLNEGAQTFARKMSTMLFILESCDANLIESAKVKHIKENYSKVMSILEEYNIELPEETTVIEQVVAALYEDAGAAGGGGAPGVSGGSGAAAGAVSTAAIAAAGKPVTTDAVDPTVPRLYPGKKKKNPNNVIAS